MNCEHCKKVFKTKSSLNHHKNKAKYCLSIQEKNTETTNKFKCQFCNKNLSSKRNLDSHLNCCSQKKDKERKEKELREINDRIQKELNELKELNSQKDNLLIEKDRIIVKINTQLENYKEQLEKQEEHYREQIKDLQDKLDRIANKAIDRPTTSVTNTTNNNLNIMTSMDFDNYETLKDAIDNNLNANHIVDGQRGLAQFLVDTILKDSDGNLKYKCTDASRGIFRFLNSQGEINKDVDAKKLISYIVSGGIKGKSVEIANSWYRDEDGGIDMMKYGIMNEPQQHILKIEDDNSTFRRELASMTSV
jgi:hypothetical protein